MAEDRKPTTSPGNRKNASGAVRGIPSRSASAGGQMAFAVLGGFTALVGLLCAFGAFYERETDRIVGRTFKPDNAYGATANAAESIAAYLPAFLILLVALFLMLFAVFARLGCIMENNERYFAEPRWDSIPPEPVEGEAPLVEPKQSEPEPEDLPERLVRLVGRSDFEMEQMLAAGLLSKEELRLVQAERARRQRLWDKH